MPVRIFINYAREDQEQAEELHRKLTEAGFAPWLDTKNLAPGRKWRDGIRQAILSADFFLACISTYSLTKKGVLRQERHKALTILIEEKLEREVYLIPVRLADCELPSELSEYQWVDLFKEDGWEKLLQAIQDEIKRWSAMVAATEEAATVSLSTEPARNEGWRAAPLADPVRRPRESAPVSKRALTRIVYINTRPASTTSKWPQEVRLIRDWSWLRSAHVRWSRVEPASLIESDAPAAMDEVVSNADLVVLDWSSDNAPEVEKVCARIRRRKSDLPILILVSDPGRVPGRDIFIASGGAHTIEPEALFDADQIAQAFRALNRPLAQPQLTLDIHEDDLVIKGIIEWVRDKQQLQLIIQKFFPDAGKATLMMPGSGWADAKLCPFYVDPNDQIYFLKFFDREDAYLSELKGYQQARAWLGKDGAALRLVPDIAAAIEAQSEAFPLAGQPRFPVCYESASPCDHPRLTLKEYYLHAPDECVEEVIERLLLILAEGQAKPLYRKETPWNATEGNDFCWTQEMKRNVLAALDDLKLYGPPLYGDEREWKERHERVRLFVYGAPPEWLTMPWPVAKGHVHGDPNPRHCLVNPDEPHDLRLIGYHRYRSDGRLVSDLALIERDIKLVLLSTDTEAREFFDLDVARLRDWRVAETEAIAGRLGYTPDSDTATHKSVRRAYSLVGLCADTPAKSPL